MEQLAPLRSYSVPCRFYDPIVSPEGVDTGLDAPTDTSLDGGDGDADPNTSALVPLATLLLGSEAA